MTRIATLSDAGARRYERRMQGYTYREIAETEGVSVGAVQASVKSHAESLGLQVPVRVLPLLGASELARELGLSEDQVARLKAKEVIVGRIYGKRMRFDIEAVKVALASYAESKRPSYKRCTVCDLELPLDAFIALKRSDKRCKPGHVWTGHSSDCRTCRKLYKRAVRFEEARAAGRTFEPRGDRAEQRDRRDAIKAERAAMVRVARAMVMLFWVLRAFGKLAMTPEQREEERKSRIALMVKQQRERRHNDPEYWASRKAMKVRRKRAIEGTQVEPVSLLRVAELDNSTCYLCGRAVPQHTQVVRDQASLEHVIALSKGGSHTYGNVRLAHRGCNSSKGAKPLATAVPPAPPPGVLVSPEARRRIAGGGAARGDDRKGV